MRIVNSGPGLAIHRVLQRLAPLEGWHRRDRDQDVLSNPMVAAGADRTRPDPADAEPRNPRPFALGEGLEYNVIGPLDHRQHQARPFGDAPFEF